MPFPIKIKRAQNQETSFVAEVGSPIFVLGANGTGKSSLMADIFRANAETAVRISAHRQSWFSSSESVAPQELRSFTSNVRNWDSDPRARWFDQVAEQRPRMAISQLVAAENVRARNIAAAADESRFDDVKTLAAVPSAIKTINELLRLSNLPLSICIKNGEQVVASKSGGPEYSIAELSDGERNALVIAATVLTTNSNTLILIDEPERHLHRSIISPLLTHLFAKRPDCAFIVSTHEVMLPLDHPDCQVLLVRGCDYAGREVAAYEVDLLSFNANIDDALKKDILGARQKILFVEGAEESLDKPLYSQVFPNVSVIAKSNCRDVEHAVRGVRDAAELHWVKAFGIVDGDGREQVEIEELKAKGIYAVPAYSIESLYYHPEIQRRVAERHAKSVGGNAGLRLTQAKDRAVATISLNLQRLSERIAEKEIRTDVLKKLPKRQDVAAGIPITFTIDPGNAVTAEKARLQQFINNQDLESIINRYPVR